VAIPSGHHSLFDKHWGFYFKTKLWEDDCNCPDDVWSYPDDVLSKASHPYKVQSSGRQSSWSGRSSIIYGNCVHQFNCLDISLQGPDAESLIIVITCSQSATVQTLGQHRPDTGLVMKVFSAILERRLQLTVRTLGQAIWTPSGILVITFYSNIGLGRISVVGNLTKNTVN
jgi:hypothetical protein